MDFSKIVDQRNSKAQATGQADVVVTTKAPERGKPGPKPRATSKRNDPAWVAATVFMTHETKERLTKVIAMGKVLGLNDPADQSEAIDAALKVYLTKLEAKLTKHVKSRPVEEMLQVLSRPD